MASQRAVLKVLERSERGSRQTRRLRSEGFVPGIICGGGEETRHFKVGERDLRNVLIEGHALFDVEVDGATPVPVIIKEQQLHPVRGSIQHLDLQQVRLDEKIQSTVAVEVEGVEDAPGVKEGGVLEHVTRELSIEALPTDIPDRVVADVSGMDINDTLFLSALTAPPGVVFLDDPDETTIATLTPPRVEEEPEVEVEEEAELVGEEGEAPEGEEAAAEGEAPAEGEAGAEKPEGSEGE
jgi:large subunit ribosomal protein L25